MIKISITGPESTGKSWLAQHLAEHYKTVWVAEYARQYLVEIKRAYTFEDILVIAQKQFENENQATKSNNLVFCDTDFCVTSIWATVKYNQKHDWIENKLNENTYSLYLLCNIDLPWEFDPLREHPEMRLELFGKYEELLKTNHFNFRIVSGIGDDRLQNAIAFVDEFLKQNRIEL